MHALFVAAITGVICLTLWTTGGGSRQPRTCVVNRDLLEPFTTEQGLLNAGMFVPVGLLGVLATRRVLGPLVAGFLLTLTIETLQGALSFLGRGCDTSDLQMNSLGVGVGVICGWLVSHLETRGGKFREPMKRSNTVAATGVFVALVATWFAFITPQSVSHTLAQR
ncbi:VanZ family protein [Streptomyces sp. A3M-1-3]|uniref:VanZ family protein n=1 Tax=Streptomyces sp. A3M-1-3 TaxID=2962044 RepID=UPI0020B63D7E|nr:VanZ family protein [Streptomyces sp. A3M-1-3]MCP3820427.1 VanZ family protein [Streptomyces sp. A3M-1-3]